MTWDYSNNRPGEQARAHAEELRSAHPMRAILARILNVQTEERAFDKGQAGEVEVARRLRRLGEEWRVLHSLPVGDGHTDIDHLVVGPAGIFTLNTKNHLGCRVWVKGNSFYVNGRYRPYVPAARSEGLRVEKALARVLQSAPKVEPIIVVLSSNFEVRRQPEDVHVVGRRWIARWLARRPRIYDDNYVELIYEVARNPEIWRTRRTPRTSEE